VRLIEVTNLKKVYGLNERIVFHLARTTVGEGELKVFKLRCCVQVELHDGIWQEAISDLEAKHPKPKERSYDFSDQELVLKWNLAEKPSDLKPEVGRRYRLRFNFEGTWVRPEFSEAFTFKP